MKFASMVSVIFLSLAMAAISAEGASEVLSVVELRCEGLREAEQVDTVSPRFSWRLENESRGVLQTAFQLRITEIDAFSRDLASPMESARISSEDSQWVMLPGFRAKPRATYAWQVRVWDNQGRASKWSEPHRFGTGLLGGKWPADWIGDGRTLGIHKTASARHFRHAFTVDRSPVSARLFVSAQGLVEPWINGQHVTQDRFVPGWPDYRKRLFYVAYDVTPLIQAGQNVWGMILGDGWYSGTMLPQHQYGQEARFSAFLDLTYADGTVTTLTTGKDWRFTDDGPITMNSIYQGESYDARRARADWCSPGMVNDWTWHEVSVRFARHFYQAFTARLSPPVRRIETLKPITVKKMGPGAFVYDLGQNMVGWVRLRVRAKAGQKITMRFAEMLTADGNIFTGNLRTAKATARYIAHGKDIEEWEPRFTFFGFRYVELTGVENPLDDAILGVVVHNELPRIGSFESSDPWLNQLYKNALWSQKGNFLEVPTDCPQRDERLGWTGDAQVFAPTAVYNLESDRFYRQWLFSVRDGLRDDPHGGFPDNAPHTGWGFGSMGWGEAGMIIPWITWLHSGDRQILAENLPAIQHALELMAEEAPDGIRRSRAAWGDWLAPGYEMYKAPPRPELIATAYFAHAADLAGRIAEVLGRPALAVSNFALRDKAKAAFVREFIAADGRVADDVQTSYLLTLAFDLAPPALREKIVGHLLRTIAEKNNHLATGFLGTPLLTPVLTSVGRTDLAYTVLKQKTFPGWLLSVTNGATTIWERWDSWTPEHGFNKHRMNSFNHYALGSVVAWFYDTIAGLQPLSEAPGWKRFRIAPESGGGLTWAAATVNTPYGAATSSWKIDADTLNLTVRIPANTHAEIVLKADSPAKISLDGAPLAKHKLASDVKAKAGRTYVTLPSGSYEFTVKVPGY